MPLPSSVRPSLESTLGSVFTEGERSEDVSLTYSTEGPALMPERVGRHRVIDLLGEGAFGQVFEAHDEELDRRVALKLLHPRATGGLSTQRLQREAQALAALEHPHVVSIYDVGSVFDAQGNARVFIAMELIDGTSLDLWLAEAARPLGEILEVMRQVAEGLIAVHGVGMVHRDLKPGNILVGRASPTEGLGRWRVRLVDFGLSRPDPERQSTAEQIVDETSLETRTSATRPTDLLDLAHPDLTATGAVVGTPAYMAPEQFLGEPCTQRSDQFAFAVILHQALTGERPFHGKDLHSLRSAVLRGIRRPPPRGKRVPRELARLIDRALHVDPDQRFDSMREVVALLQASASAPSRWVMGVCGLTVVSLFGTGLWWSTTPTRDDCLDPDRALGEAWSRKRARQVDAALRANEAPWAEATASRVRGRIDDYASTWGAAYARACELADDDPVRDRQMACLAGARRELDAVTEVLARSEPEVASRAVSIAAGLPPVAECERASASSFPRIEGARAALADELQGRLARARALQHAGLYEEAQELARGVLREAEAAQLTSIAASTGHLLGMLHAGAGAFERAEESLTHAYFTAQAVGDDAAAARAAVGLVGVVGGALGRSEDGGQWERHAETHLGRLDDARSIRASLEQRRGQMAWAAGDFAAAQAHFELGQQLHQAVEPDDPGNGKDLDMIGVILLEQGRFEQSRDVFAQAVQMLERDYGEQHPTVALSLFNLGHAHFELRDLEAAERAYTRARDIYVASFGSEHIHTIECEEALGNVAMARDEHHEAIATFARVLEAYETLGRAHSFEASLSHQNLGLALAKAGELGQAISQLEIGLDLVRETRPPDHPEVGRVLDLLGSVLIEAGRHDEAFAAALEAREVHQAKLPADHPVIAGIEKDIGMALSGLGRHDEALEHLRIAERMLQGRPERARDLASTRFAIGRVLWEAGRRDEARTQVERAAAGTRELGERAESLAAEISAWRERHGG